MTERSTAVLLVEDDEDVRRATALLLTRKGFDVLTAENGLDAHEQLRSRSVDLVVADIGMPDMDGITFTRRLRATSHIPILLLTARDLPSDVITGLEAGADDYLTKPFDGDVLVARLRALERRALGKSSPVERVGALRIDRSGRTVHRGEAPVVLSPTEFRLLETLLDAGGAAVSRQQALRIVWGEERWIDERVVDTNVLRLRSKLGDDVIETVRGHGYRLRREW